MKVQVKNGLEIESGFRSGSAIRVSADGGATWDMVASVPDATYVGDEIYRESVTLSSGQWAVGSWFNQGHSGTGCYAADEATAAQFQTWLDSPASKPENGGVYYFLDRQGEPATIRPVEVRTNADWIRHFELGAELHEFRATEWTSVRYEWGCQDAACWWRIGPDGLEEISGVGDDTPSEPDAAGNYTTPREEWEHREELMYAAEDGDRAAMHELNGHLPPAVVDHLAAGYAAEINPLKGLRKRGYSCEYHRDDYHAGNTAIWDGDRWHYLTITK